MAHSKAVTPTACTCDCQEDLEPERQVSGWQNCECIFCGPLLEDGSRKCQVQVSPVLMMATAIQSGVPKTGPLPVFCGSCREYCLFVKRCVAVIRAREARKTQRSDTEAHRSRSRSRDYSSWVVPTISCHGWKSSFKIHGTIHASLQSPKKGKKNNSTNVSIYITKTTYMQKYIYIYF